MPANRGRRSVNLRESPTSDSERIMNGNESPESLSERLAIHSGKVSKS